MFVVHSAAALEDLSLNIATPYRDLGEIEITPLKEALLAEKDESWLANTERQNSFEVHKQTQSLVLVFCDGKAGELTVCKEEAWDRLADVALPVMHELIERCYTAGGTIIRAMAAKLPPGGRINPHFDAHASFSHSHRVHVPITTNPRVRFMIDGKPFRPEIGKAYEINNQKTHSVVNTGTEGRITFIFDYMPADRVSGSELS